MSECYFDPAMQAHKERMQQVGWGAKFGPEGSSIIVKRPLN
jgi:hypothetical protein